MAVEKEIAALGKKARDGKLTLEDMSGGTFTISNDGVFGSLYGTPIINPPQSAVLGLHKISEKVVPVDGKVVIRPYMTLASVTTTASSTVGRRSPSSSASSSSSRTRRRLLFTAHKRPPPTSPTTLLFPSLSTSHPLSLSRLLPALSFFLCILQGSLLSLSFLRLHRCNVSLAVPSREAACRREERGKGRKRRSPVDVLLAVIAGPLRSE